jgi:hypothetical protein
VLAASACEPPSAFALSGFAIVRAALAMTIANIPICVGHALDLAFIATEALFANTLGEASLFVHKAGSVCTARSSVAVFGAFHAALFTHETLFAFANSLTLGLVLFAHSPGRTATNTTHGILSAA